MRGFNLSKAAQEIVGYLSGLGAVAELVYIAGYVLECIQKWIWPNWLILSAMLAIEATFAWILFASDFEED